MNIEYFRYLYDYHFWANARILTAAENISRAEFVAPIKFSHGSLRGTLVHALSAEWIWLSRWQGVSPTAMWHEESVADIAQLRAHWRDQEQKMRDWLLALNDADTDRIIRYTNTRGKEFARPLWEMLAHVVNHGTQHYAEAAASLTELGHSPGDIDLVFFADERRSK